MQDQGEETRRQVAQTVTRNRAASWGTPYSSSFWSRSCCGWRSSPSATPTASRPAATTFSLDGKWDASPDPSPLGQGFSSPTDLPTGPSAWAPPVYPYILAGVFKLFGIYSNAFRMGDPYLQQHFFGADLSHPLSHRGKNLWSCGGASHGLDLGTVSLRDLLAGARGLGDESERVPVELGFAG